MTTYTGTAGFDSLIGANFVADQFYFDATTLSATDIVAGGLSDSLTGDSLILGAGTYTAGMFAGVTGIDLIVLDGPASITLDSALLAQGGVTGPDLLLQVRTGAGDDWIDASGAVGNGAWFFLGGGNDVVFGSEEADSFAFNPVATGNYTLDGNGGNDTFWIDNQGSYTVDGGTGTDEIYFAGAPGDLWLDLAAAGNQLDIDGGTITGSVTGVERLHGSMGVNTFFGSSANEEFFGGGLGDILSGRGGSDALWGYGGDDVLRGGAGNDALLGGEGTDTADYASATDILDIDLERLASEVIGSGQTGTDSLYDIEVIIGGTQGDTMAGDAGDNVFEGRGGHDILSGRDGADTLRGGSGRDTLDGGDGDDRLFGDAGDDTLDGGEGFDRLYGGAGFDMADYGDVTGVAVVDLLVGTATDGGARTHLLFNIEGALGGSGGDRLSGNAADNRLEGRGGADILFGREGDDILDGGGQADTLDGGADDDILTGGAGGDTFSFTSTGTGYGNDTIADWQDGTDALEFYGAGSLSITTVGGDALVEIFDAGLVSLGTVTVTGAAGLIDATDYTLIP